MLTIHEQVDATDMTTSTTVMDLSGDVLGAVFYDSSIEEVTPQRLKVVTPEISMLSTQKCRHCAVETKRAHRLIVSACVAPRRGEHTANIAGIPLRLSIAVHAAMD